MQRGEALSPAEAAERIASRFGDRFAAAVVLRRDLDVASELAMEARPVAEALVAGVRCAARIDPDDGALREAVALASLLGRRAAVLGATPTAAVAIVPCLLDAVAEEEPRARELVDPLRAVCVEGYVAAREEALEADAARRAADAIAIIEPAAGCMCAIVRGVQEASELERVFDELGRELLDRDARSCLVDLGGLRGTDPESVRQLFAIHATCTMLGVCCIFTRVSDACRRAASEAGLDLGDVRIEPELTSGLRDALSVVGVDLKARAGIGEVLRRIVGRS